MCSAVRPLRPFGTGPLQIIPFGHLPRSFKLVGRDVVITGRGFLLFPKSTFASHPANLATHGCADQIRSPCIAVRLHFLKGEPLGYQDHCAFHLALQHTSSEITDLHFPHDSRIPLSWLTDSIRSVYPYS